MHCPKPSPVGKEGAGEGGDEKLATAKEEAGWGPQVSRGVDIGEAEKPQGEAWPRKKPGSKH